MGRRTTTRRYGFRRPALFATLLAGALVAGLLAAAPASAVGCRGVPCRGADPQAKGCSPGSYTAADHWYYGTNSSVVELRYSPSCQAFWARYKMSGPSCCPWATLREEQQKYIGGVWETWWVQDRWISLAQTTGVWTRMNPNEANDRHRACIVEYNRCTHWV